LNFHALAKLLGLLLATFGASMAPSLAWGLYYADASRGPLLGSMMLTMAFGGALFWWGRRKPQEVFRKEATAVVGLGWIVSALAGALPYYFADLKEMPTFADCFFVAMSGLTTTGAGVVGDIEAMPKGILFWRSFTHWLGGLGIIMLFVAVLPYLGAGGRALVRSEVTGPVKEGLTPRIKDTAQLLYKLYIGYTIGQTVLLMLAGMDFFDALCHTFGTLATGGFSTKNASVAAYREMLGPGGAAAVEWIVIVFMLLAGMNFALMHSFFRRKWTAPLRDPEWRVYVAIVAVGSAAIWLLHDGTDGATGRDAVFTAASIVTTTGYVTADFESWPAGAKAILACLMFVGGCAGSTGGGMKVLRWIVLWKIARATVETIYRPHTVRGIKLGGRPLDEAMQRSILTFALIWFLIFALASIGVAILEGGRADLLTCFSAVSSTLNNIGPGFGLVQPTSNYADFGEASKWLLSLCMVLGRLEVFSIVVLFMPRFWLRG
jgi:trk system potassium uptake protein TrkH